MKICNEEEGIDIKTSYDHVFPSEFCFYICDFNARDKLSKDGISFLSRMMRDVFEAQISATLSRDVTHVIAYNHPTKKCLHDLKKKLLSFRRNHSDRVARVVTRSWVDQCISDVQYISPEKNVDRFTL